MIWLTAVPEFVKLKMWKTFETNGFLFIWFHAEDQEPTWHPDPIAEVNEGTWSYRGRSEMRVACHIQVLELMKLLKVCRNVTIFFFLFI